MILRTVVEQDYVSSIIDAEGELYPRLEAAFDALKWWLAHKPESGEPIDDHFWLWKQAGDLEQKIPALVALYWYDSATVTIVSILVKLPAL